MQSFDELISRIQALGERIEFAGPQSQQAIVQLETALHLKLPESYRDFLSRYGAGGTVGSWIAGIYGNNPLMSNDGYAYGETTRIREEYGLPDGLLVVQSSAPEFVWCLDMRQTKGNAESPVVAVDVLNGFKTEPIARTFGDFFREYLEVRAEGGV
jgi:hypothetical protein